MTHNTPKLAVVTGGNAGIGAAIATQLLEEGWHVAISDIRETSETDALKKTAKRLDAHMELFECDVRSKEKVANFYDKVADSFGTAPDLLVNNAGVQTWSSLLDLAESDWDKVIGTNLKGSFLNTQLAAKAMIAVGKKGAIINIGSGCNTLAFPKLVDYSASKGGIEMLTKVSAVELGPHDIRVNCVAPGGVLIERTKREAPDYGAAWSSITPLGRVGYPSDIANAVSFLASDKANFITGQTLYVDGGAYSKANWPYQDAS